MRTSTWTDFFTAWTITLVAGGTIGMDGVGDEYAIMEADPNESVAERKRRVVRYN